MAEGSAPCFVKKLPVIVCTLFANGGGSCLRTTRWPGSRPNSPAPLRGDYVNLGYKDGSAAVMRVWTRFRGSVSRGYAGDAHRADSDHARHPKRPGREGGLFRRDGSRGILDHPMHPQSGTPVISGPTAVGAPKYYAYLNAGQLVGWSQA